MCCNFCRIFACSRSFNYSRVFKHPPQGGHSKKCKCITWVDFLNTLFTHFFTCKRVLYKGGSHKLNRKGGVEGIHIVKPPRHPLTLKEVVTILGSGECEHT